MHYKGNARGCPTRGPGVVRGRDALEGGGGRYPPPTSGPPAYAQPLFP